MKTLHIITINTWKCDGNYRARLQLMAEQLALLKPDIIACQECFVSAASNADTLSFLADRLNMNVLFAPGRSKKRLFEGEWVDSSSGLGVLSIHPITEVDIIDLPAAPEDNDRKAQQIAVHLPGGKDLLLTNIHLTHLPNAGELRKEQLLFAAKKTERPEKYIYKIICGDLNAELHSPEITAFKNTAGALDRYAAGNGPEPRGSLVEFWQRNSNVCVDHIFALPSASGSYPECAGAAIVLNKPDGSGLLPSDHFGVSATIII